MFLRSRAPKGISALSLASSGGLQMDERMLFVQPGTVPCKGCGCSQAACWLPAGHWAAVNSQTAPGGHFLPCVVARPRSRVLAHAAGLGRSRPGLSRHQSRALNLNSAAALIALQLVPRRAADWVLAPFGGIDPTLLLWRQQ